MRGTDPPITPSFDGNDEDRNDSMAARSSPRGENLGGEGSDATSPARPKTMRKRGHMSGEKDPNMTTRKIRRDEDDSSSVDFKLVTQLNNALGEKIEKGMVNAARIKARNNIEAAKIAAEAAQRNIMITAGSATFQALLSAGKSEEYAENAALGLMDKLISMAQLHRKTPFWHGKIQMPDYAMNIVTVVFICAFLHICECLLPFLM